MNANGLPAIRTRAPRTPTRAGRGDERGLTDAAETRNGEGDDDDGSRRGRLRSKSLAQRLAGMQDGTRDAADRYEKTKTIRAANTFSRRNRSGKLWENEDAAAPGTPSVGGAGADWRRGRFQYFQIKYADRAAAERSFSLWLDTAGVIEQDSEFLKRWDLLTATFLVFVALVTPFELGFLETEVDTVGGVALFALNRVVDLVFFVDIFVQMNTMFIDSKGRKVYSRALIMRNYARTWFLVDFVSILPFELTIFLLTRGNPTSSQSKLKAVRFIRLLRLLKLLRVFRGMRIFQRWEARLALNYALISLQKYFLTLLLAAHWIGCTLMLTHQLLAPDCEAEDIAEDRCTFLYFYLDGKLVPASVWNKYALALYFATGELMGTPYGDIIPVRGEERLFFIICHLGAGFVNAYLVGGMVSAITALNARNQRFYNSMDILNRFLTEKKLIARNPKLCERLRLYYIFKHKEGGGDGWGDIVENTSREMQGEVVQELHSDWLERVHYFSGVDRNGIEWEVDDEFKLNLSLSMHIIIVAPLEAVFKEDSPIDALYVIQRGLVGCQTRVLRKGEAFGDDVFVYYQPPVDAAVDGNLPASEGTYSSRPYGRGYRATALINTVLMEYEGAALHELLNRPKYEFIKGEIRRKMFRWQLRHVMKTMYGTLRKAAAEATYGDGMQILVAEYGYHLLTKVPSIQFHYMRLREEAGDDEVKVMRLFRKMWNRKKFTGAVEKLIHKRRRVNALTELLREMREFLQPLGAVTYAERLIANGVTLRTVREYSVLELVTSGLPVVLAKRTFKASRDLPETRDQEYGEDGVAVDARIWAGASFASRGPRNLDADALFEELHEIKEEERRKRLAQMALGLGDLVAGGGGGPGTPLLGGLGAGSGGGGSGGGSGTPTPTAGGARGAFGGAGGAAQLRRIPSVRGFGAPQRSSKHM